MSLNQVSSFVGLGISRRLEMKNFEMKLRYYLCVIILLSVPNVVISQEIPIQLMLVDNSGFEKVNHYVKLRLTMSNDTSSTLGQYQEVHLTQSNEYGIISENIGSGVATTNSQVLSLEQFTFLTNEPIIQIELDTSSASNQYYTVGYVSYNYPIVARRALSADSSDYSDQSINSEYSDTAEFARNFNESFDGDTSDVNELQELTYDALTRTLSITDGNQISLGLNSPNEVETSLIELNSSLSANIWRVADSQYLYSWDEQNQYYIKALIIRPDSIIDSVDVGFYIKKLFPSDSVIFGNSAGYLKSCDLNGANIQTKYVGTSAVSSINHPQVSLLENNISWITYYNYDYFLESWNLDSNIVTSTNLGDFLISWSENYVITKYWSTYGIDSQGQGYYFRTINRLNGQSSDLRLKQYGNVYFEAIDTSGKKTIRSYYPVNDKVSYSVRDTSYNEGGFTLIGSSNNSFVEGEDGFYLTSRTINSSYTTQKMYLINTNSIGSDKSITKLVLEDWEIHPEANGQLYIIPGNGEFIVLFSNIKHWWINNQYRSGNLILRVPFYE